MRLARLPFLAALTLTLFGCNQQSKCALTLEQSPAIRGIRLGMTTEQIQSLFPEIKLEQSKDDRETGFQSGLIYGSNSQLQGIKTISLDFLDNRLYEFRVEYQDTGEFKRSEQFLEAITPQLGLPEKWWGESVYETGVLECKGFTLTAGLTPDPPPGAIDVSGRPRSITLSLVDMPSRVERYRRLQEKKDRQRGTFKP